MVKVKRLVLDVLKPHHPSALEFAREIAKQGIGYRVRLTVEEVDEKTETAEVVVEGGDISFDKIEATITRLGGSLHSVDEVEVLGSGHTED